jgi:hypothetical protein
LQLDSPFEAVANWRSPVLLVNGGADRNVPFHQRLIWSKICARKTWHSRNRVIAECSSSPEVGFKDAS